MSLGLIFWIVMQNFTAIGSAVLKKMMFEVVIFGNLLDIPKLKLWVMGGRMRRCKAVHLAELSFCTFCKPKTRGETQFWIELAATCSLDNHNEVNSNYTLPFIILLSPSLAMAPITTGVNACCYRHVPYDIINKPYLAASRRKMPKVSLSHWMISFSS